MYAFFCHTILNFYMVVANNNHYVDRYQMFLFRSQWPAITIGDIPIVVLSILWSQGDMTTDNWRTKYSLSINFVNYDLNFIWLSKLLFKYHMNMSSFISIVMQLCGNGLALNFELSTSPYPNIDNINVVAWSVKVHIPKALHYFYGFWYGWVVCFPRNAVPQNIINIIWILEKR